MIISALWLELFLLLQLEYEDLCRKFPAALENLQEIPAPGEQFTGNSVYCSKICQHLQENSDAGSKIRNFPGPVLLWFGYIWSNFPSFTVHSNASVYSELADTRHDNEVCARATIVAHVASFLH